MDSLCSQQFAEAIGDPKSGWLQGTSSGWRIPYREAAVAGAKGAGHFVRVPISQARRYARMRFSRAKLQRAVTFQLPARNSRGIQISTGPMGVPASETWV